MNNIQTNLKIKKPILYTFRRCPYAMRARLAVQLSGIKFEYREILLRDKPKEMLEASPKGTVPVLITDDGKVIDESIDIMFWALQKCDPDNLLDADNLEKSKKLISINDLNFKNKLDHYKYAVRFPDKSEVEYRNECLFFLKTLDEYLQQNQFLFGEKISFADIAIFPFIRQFAFVDKLWFDSTKYEYLKNWLDKNLESELFIKVMIKRKLWKS